MQALSNWLNFYMILGTAAATLIGLMFVVTTLLTGIETHIETLNAGVEAFNTPIVVHFCAVLLIAGILSAPWQSFVYIQLLLGLFGLGMVFYMLIVVRRMRRMAHYQNSFTDWLWYVALPLIAYVALIVAAITLQGNPALVLYIISAAMLILLFIAIRNAWDLVTFFAVERSHAPANKNIAHQVNEKKKTTKP